MINLFDKEPDSFQKHVARSFNDYLNIIKNIKGESSLMWYRGQSKASYRLIPKAMRYMVEFENQFGQSIEPRLLTQFNNRGNSVKYINVNNMLEEFKKKARDHIRIEPKNDFEWLFIAQHYGVPTKLLDWTTDPLVSLFFSLPKDLSSRKVVSTEDAIMDFERNSLSELGATVFAFNPCKINELYHEIKTETFEPIDAVSNYEILKGYIHPSENKNFTFPLCILGTSLDQRICRQSGNFTMHGEMVWPIDFRECVQKEIHKIFIPYDCIEKIREWLNTLDITEKSICGNSELDLISSDIDKYEQNRFTDHINEMVKLYKRDLLCS